MITLLIILIILTIILSIYFIKHPAEYKPEVKVEDKSFNYQYEDISNEYLGTLDQRNNAVRNYNIMKKSLMKNNGDKLDPDEMESFEEVAKRLATITNGAKYQPQNKGRLLKSGKIDSLPSGFDVQ